VLVFCCLSLVVASPVRTEVRDNREFCSEALAESCDSLLARLELPSGGALSLPPVAAGREKLLSDRLTENLQRLRYAVYLSDSATDVRPLLQASLDRFEFDYRGISTGLLSGLRVERRCAVSVSARLLGDERRLLRTAAISGFEKREVLEYEVAERARSGDGFYAPKMPPSLLQRVIEPALIISITGALVYLFFASR
jgi:hypothetical protein